MSWLGWLGGVGVEEGSSGCHELYERSSGCVACWLSDGLGT